MNRTLYLIATFQQGLHLIEAYIYENQWKAETDRRILEIIYRSDPASHSYEIEVFSVMLQTTEYEALIRTGQVGVLFIPTTASGRQVYLIPQDTGRLAGRTIPNGTVISHALYKNPRLYVKLDYIWEFRALRSAEQRDIYYGALEQLHHELNEAGFTLDVLIYPDTQTIYLEGLTKLDPEIIGVMLTPALKYLGISPAGDPQMSAQIDDLIVQVEAGLWQCYEAYVARQGAIQTGG